MHKVGINIHKQVK